MSVLQLRRNMVVDDASSEDVVEIEKPFPLRTLEPIDTDAVVIEEPAGGEDADEGRSLLDTLRFWFNVLIVAAVIAIYPGLVLLSGGIGDRAPPAIDRSAWTAPWVGAVNGLLEPQFGRFGWAPDAHILTPMARLTAKPAYQRALAETTGDYVAHMHARSVAAGRDDGDLEAAARLISSSSTGVQVRAGRDALLSYDRRLRRTTTANFPDARAQVAQLSLIESWGKRSQAEISATASSLGGNPMDENATTAVYAAKGRAMAAYAFIDAMPWPDVADAVSARAAALDAWRRAAQFHPLLVLNGSPDGSLFGNHPASMGYLIAQAQSATAEFRAAVETASVITAPAAGAATRGVPAEGPAAASSPVPPV